MADEQSTTMEPVNLSDLLREAAAARSDSDAYLMVTAAEALRRIARTAEMSANIMRDNRRTNGWEGAERVARQFERIAETAKGETA